MSSEISSHLCLNQNPQSSQILEELTGEKPTFIMGDLHGDYSALTEVLERAGLATFNKQGCHWAGGDKTFIQFGDILDRGSDENKTWQCLRQLQNEAGSDKVVRLIGNHELMRLDGDDRYVNSETDISSDKERRFLFNMKTQIVNGRLKAAHLIDGDILVTHAGLKEKLAQKIVTEIGSECVTKQDLVDHINNLLVEETKKCRKEAQRCNFHRSHDLFSASPARGGRGTGGIFWTDYNQELQHERGPIIDRLVQVVGHTAAACDAHDESCQPIRAAPHSVCVDAGLSYAYKDNRAYLEYTRYGELLSHVKRADAKVLGNVYTFDPEKGSSFEVLKGDERWTENDLTDAVLPPVDSHRPFDYSTLVPYVLKGGIAIAGGAIGIQRLSQGYADLKEKKVVRGIANLALGFGITGITAVAFSRIG